MKQVFTFSGEISVEEIPVPACGANEVLVQNMLSVVSAGTEGASIKASRTGIVGLARQAKDRPELVRMAIEMAKRKGVAKTLELVRSQAEGRLMPLGYSCSGVVMEVGRNVNDISVGDRVACAGAGYACHAEMVVVPRNLVCKIPDMIGFDEAAFTTLGAIAIQGVRRAQVQVGDRVVVLGLGLIGQLTCQILKASGALVIGVDPLEERVKLANNSGVDLALVSGQDVVSQVLLATDGLGGDSVIICADTRSSEPVHQAMWMARMKGRVVVVGAVGMQVDRSTFYEKELDFLMSCSYGPGRYDPAYEEKGIDYPVGYVRWTENRNMQAFVELLSQKKVDVKRLVGGVYSIDEAKKAYEALGSRTERPIAVLFKYRDDLGGASSRSTQLRPLERVSGKTNVAVIGAGSFARAHRLPNLKRIPFFNLRAVATKTGVSARSAAAKYGAQYCTTDHKVIFNDKDVDLVLIATRHDLHASLVAEAVMAGKHIFVEKPIGLTYEECKEVYKSVAGGSVNLVVGFNRRFSPLAQRAKRVVEQRGNPVVIAYRVNSPGMKKEHWVNDLDEGGGAIVGEGCHFFDFISWLIGSEPKTVYAEMISSNDASIVDKNNVVCTLSYEDGSVASITYTTVGSEHFPKERLEAFVDGGVVLIEDFRRLEVVGRRSGRMRSSSRGKGHLELLWEYGRFLRGEGSGVNLPTVQDGVRATVCSLKVLDALQTGKVQEFAYPY